MRDSTSNYQPNLPYGRKLYKPTGPPLGGPGQMPAGSRKRCKVCKHRVRGYQHDQGAHHARA